MEPKDLVTNKLLVWVSRSSKWLLKERNGTESNGTKRLKAYLHVRFQSAILQ